MARKLSPARYVDWPEIFVLCQWFPVLGMGAGIRKLTLVNRLGWQRILLKKVYAPDRSIYISYLLGLR